MKEIFKKIFPFLLMLVITPFYILMDKLILVDIFGYGCVPSAQVNRLNISFNANDLRLVVYGILTIAMIIVGIRISQTFEKK